MQTMNRASFPLQNFIIVYTLHDWLSIFVYVEQKTFKSKDDTFLS